jgi:AraC-like DNA-binding protein
VYAECDDGFLYGSEVHRSCLDGLGYTRVVTTNPPVVRRLAPPLPLSRFVDCFWIQYGYSGPQARERVLPTGTMDLVFAMDGEGRAASTIAGARSEFLDLDTSRPFSAIGIHFRPGGGSPFFGVPTSEVRNQNVALDLLWGSFATMTADRLWAAGTPKEQFRILEDALLDKGRGRLVFHPAVQYAVDLIERSSGALSVNDLVERIGMSSRRFLDVFRSEVGLSPKAFCRVRRFATVLRRIERVIDVDWVEVALSCGYFDQAHFNHDFRAFSGLSPSVYLRQHISRTHVVITP